MGTMCLDPVGKHPFIGRCRKCGPCRRQDAWEWSRKAMLETLDVKSVFATYTFRPRGKHWKPSDEQCWPDVDKMLKRLRATGLRFRYFAAPEYGDRRGRHHYHVLFHGDDITTKNARSQWKQGITHARRISEANRAEHCGYVADYASKQSGRKRASLSYGCAPVRQTVEHELFKEVAKHFPGAYPAKIDGITIPRKTRRKVYDERVPAIAAANEADRRASPNYVRKKGSSTSLAGGFTGGSMPPVTPVRASSDIGGVDENDD